ncbi:glycosyltransferase family 2 protein [Limosilactobacillus ingluviei]
MNSKVTNSCKLSIVVPVYNVGKYIHGALESIQKQSFTDYEVIIVDDKGNDDSMEKATAFTKDSRFKIISNSKNLGLAESRNVGNEYANGEYIFYMDADDLIPPQFLKSIMGELENKDYDIVVFNRSDFIDGEILKFKNDSSLVESKVETDRNNLLLKLLSGVVETTAWSYIFSARLLKENDLKFSKGRLYEDTDFTPMLFNVIENGCILKLSPYGYCYRIEREGSIMQKSSLQKTFKMCDDRYFVLQRKYKTLKTALGTNNEKLDIWYFNEMCGLILAYQSILKKHNDLVKDMGKSLDEAYTTARKFLSFKRCIKYYLVRIVLRRCTLLR